MFFRRKLPLTITFVMGIVLLLQFFIPKENPVSKKFFEELTTTWMPIIGAFFLIIGLVSLLRFHYNKITHMRAGWGYSLITLGGIVLMCVIGFGWGGPKSVPFTKAFDSIMVPLDSTMFSVLAFYMASAAFRAFRARTILATVLLLTAFIVMLGRVPLGSFIWEGMPHLTEWIMTVPNMAQERGLLLGIGLGSLATSLKIIFGIERAYLGGKD